MFPEDPKDPELSEEAEELLTHWPLTDKSPEEWEDLALRIDARIKITDVGSTPDYLLEAPVLEEQDLLRRSHPRMKRPSEGSLVALAKATQETSTDREREALARSLLSLAVKARSETQNTTEHRDPGADLAKLVNGGPAMQFLAARPPRHVRHTEGASDAGSVEATPASSTASTGSTSTASIVSATSAASAATAKSSRERGSMWFGIAFGLLGMAAAGVMYIASTRAPAPAAEAALAARPPAAPAKAEVPAPAAKAATPAGDLLNVEEVPLADATPVPAAALSKDALPKAGPAKEVLTKDGVAAARPAARAPVAPAAAAPGAEEPARVSPPPSGPSEPNMVMADSQGTLPDHPSTGAVQAAVGTVMGAARACVAGQNDASRATLSFGSDGRVQSVAVTGPAQATSAEPCLRSALSGARVQPFARASYSVTLTVRPQQ